MATRSVPPDQDSAAPSGLRLALLGGFRVFLQGQTIPDEAWTLRKARAIVKLLALAPAQRLEREQLLELLWPDDAPSTAASNLRYALHIARRALAAVSPAPMPIIVTQGTALALQAPAGTLWIDVVAFEGAAATARRTGDLADAQAAVAATSRIRTICAQETVAQYDDSRDGDHPRSGRRQRAPRQRIVVPLALSPPGSPGRALDGTGRG